MSNMDTNATLEGTDAYFHEYTARAEAGTASPLDRANAALLATEQAVGILTGDTENVSTDKRAQITARLLVAREAASRTARFLRSGQDEQAEAFATVCERIAVSTRDLDSARFEGLSAPVPFEDGRKRRIARQG
jgi:hypothetical protein